MTREELEAARLVAEIEKIKVETSALRGTPWSRMTEAVKIIGAVLAAVIAGFAGVKAWELNEVKTELTERKLRDARDLLRRTDDKLKDTSFRLAEADAQVKVKQAQLAKVIPLGNAQFSRAVGPTQAASPLQERWVYLGTYQPDKGWETKYLVFLDNPHPIELIGRRLTVPASLNIRPGLPNANGLLPAAIGTLSPRSGVTIEEVKQWAPAPYWFAKIRKSVVPGP
jgi:hypothetical protein